MLSQKVQELELQNRRLKIFIEKSIQAGIPKLKNCENCEHFMQYYWRDDYGTFHKIYAGVVFVEYQSKYVKERKTHHQRICVYVTKKEVSKDGK